MNERITAIKRWKAAGEPDIMVMRQVSSSRARIVSDPPFVREDVDHITAVRTTNRIKRPRS